MFHKDESFSESNNYTWNRLLRVVCRSRGRMTYDAWIGSGIYVIRNTTRRYRDGRVTLDFLGTRRRDATARIARSGGRRSGGAAGGGRVSAGRGAAITSSLAGGGAGRGRPSPSGGRAQRRRAPQSGPCWRRARTRMSLAVVPGDVRWPPPLPQCRAISAQFSRPSTPVEGSRAFEPARRRPPWI